VFPDNLTGPLSDAAAAVKVLARTGLVSLIRPDRLIGMTSSFVHWGMSPAAMYAANAARDPNRIAVIDERESVSYREIDERSTAVAHELALRGVQAGDPVALLARNSAQFVVGMVAICKLGADVLYLNTGFAGAQLGDVLKGEKAAAVIADDEFVPLLDEVAPKLPRLVAWVDDGTAGPDTVAGAAKANPTSGLPSPSRDGKQVILTSGTTGRPKGAARSAPSPIAGMIEFLAVLEAIPYHAREVTVLAAPAFHAWGFANLMIGMGLQSTLVMRRRFDPEKTLKLVEKHHAHTLAAVPVMVQRIMDLPKKKRKIDASSLRVVALSGSALPPVIATKFMDDFGDVIYSLYGSTEVSYVSVAGPSDLREAPGSAGRLVRGVTVRLVDDDGNDVAAGETGRIFAGSPLAFEGYTSGEDKDRLGALTSTGDMGRFDDSGRLFVEGRDDDMIVSGGENVFPAEVEDLLHQHRDVADVAVVGVEDERFGQALVAHVVLRKGASASPNDLRAHVKKSLANYKVPREVVIHDDLPRNESGKVVKRELVEDKDGKD
jgi:acyl-CoA synthetase (AMP-forming)/AMP-acid ligase II